ncbi:hypothetical protein BLNAU_19606 [Blattamonas nauphoetae]|uniref:SH3 domain-containing protein n=1 Tax=Blattamonas nauphoetae TaxID=2049346 RepID=A0ABQ9X3F8_9EUKA|nr:hypothetical protein BLNAU_19606 [Blattamonas nauphoetae]
MGITSSVSATEEGRTKRQLEAEARERRENERMVADYIASEERRKAAALQEERWLAAARQEQLRQAAARQEYQQQQERRQLEYQRLLEQHRVEEQRARELAANRPQRGRPEPTKFLFIQPVPEDADVEDICELFMYYNPTRVKFIKKEAYRSCLVEFETVEMAQTEHNRRRSMEIGGTRPKVVYTNPREPDRPPPMKRPAASHRPVREPIPPSNEVKISNIPQDITRTEVQRILDPLKAQSIRIKPHPTQEASIAFVVFADVPTAEQAVEMDQHIRYNGHLVHIERVKPNPHQQPVQTVTPWQIRIENLPDTVNDNGINLYFAGIEMLPFRLLKSRDNMRHLYLSFQTREEMEKALDRCDGIRIGNVDQIVSIPSKLEFKLNNLPMNTTADDIAAHFNMDQLAKIHFTKGGRRNTRSAIVRFISPQGMQEGLEVSADLYVNNQRTTTVLSYFENTRVKTTKQIDESSSESSEEDNQPEPAPLIEFDQNPIDDTPDDPVPETTTISEPSQPPQNYVYSSSPCVVISDFVDIAPYPRAMACRQGEIVSVKEFHPSGWCFAYVEGTTRCGVVPSSFLCRYDPYVPQITQPTQFERHIELGQFQPFQQQ